MNIILQNIPPDTSINDISNFIKSSYDLGMSSFFTPSAQIKEINIFLQDIHSYKYDHRLTYFGLVTLEPNNVAERTITRLNKKFFKGKRIKLREFAHRSWHNDKRNQTSSESDSEINRRKTDRRLNKLENVYHIVY